MYLLSLSLSPPFHSAIFVLMESVYKAGALFEIIIRRLFMRVYGLEIPKDKGQTNLDLDEYAKRLRIEKFRST